MKKRIKVELRGVKAAENMKLRWKAARQIQQELLEKKLLQCFLSPGEDEACIKQYPMAMQPLMREFIRKAEEQMRTFRI
ncbi:MAG: hypothetical protein ABSG57_10485 [Candidatus Bathyarchaeia archaeon]|jgi:hypothetical protein